MYIYIVIVNYNGCSDTIECIDSLLKQQYVNFKIVIIDNDSSDSSVSEIEKYFKKVSTDYKILKCEDVQMEYGFSSPKLSILSSNINGGFSYANNIGLKYIKGHNDCSNILFLNNDTIVAPNFLKVLEEFYVEKTTACQSKIVIGCKELSYYNNNINHNGYYYLNLISGIAFKKSIYPSYRYIVGACIFLDNDAPLFDERYFLYFEDSEYSKSLAFNGYNSFVCDSTFYMHKVGRSSAKSIALFKIQLKSMELFYKRHYRHYVIPVLIIRLFVYLFFFKFRKAILLLKYFR
jgi:GT2 family glycosyltransferase